MNKPRVHYIFLGLLIGAIVGFGIGVLNGNAIHGMQLGALTGLFLGWILTAPVLLH